MADRSLTSRVARIGPAVVCAIAMWALVAAMLDGRSTPEPVDISADGPSFDTLDGLFGAADVVVEGEVVAVDMGRPITDPGNPDAGVVTSLSVLEVSNVFKGSAASRLTIEQEATLLDGTPIVVNGLEANEVGDTGVWFLAQGTTDEFPHLALVNEQSRVLVDGDRLRTGDARSAFLSQLTDLADANP